jgi:hypothetical protein
MCAIGSLGRIDVGHTRDHSQSVGTTLKDLRIEAMVISDQDSREQLAEAEITSFGQDEGKASHLVSYSKDNETSPPHRGCKVVVIVGRRFRCPPIPTTALSRRLTPPPGPPFEVGSRSSLSSRSRERAHRSRIAPGRGHFLQVAHCTPGRADHGSVGIATSCRVRLSRWSRSAHAMEMGFRRMGRASIQP